MINHFTIVFLFSNRKEVGGRERLYMCTSAESNIKKFAQSHLTPRNLLYKTMILNSPVSDRRLCIIPYGRHLSICLMKGGEIVRNHKHTSLQKGCYWKTK